MRSATLTYEMDIYVRGGCRRINSEPGFIGAALSIQAQPDGQAIAIWQRQLPSIPTPTNQRAELTAIVLALEQAIEESEKRENVPFMHVKVFTDSNYAIDCMMIRKQMWESNGFVNARGKLIGNRDLLRQAYGLLQGLGYLHARVEFRWISREENHRADEDMKEVLDEMEKDVP